MSVRLASCGAFLQDAAAALGARRPVAGGLRFLDDSWIGSDRCGWKMDPLPSGELTVCHGKSPCLMGKSTLSMAIFHCYVSSPEGNGFIDVHCFFFFLWVFNSNFIVIWGVTWDLEKSFFHLWEMIWDYFVGLSFLFWALLTRFGIKPGFPTLTLANSLSDQLEKYRNITKKYLEY